MSYRAVVWGTGNVGVQAIRAVVANPRYELAGVFVTNPAKSGRDAGEIARIGPLGVAATADRADLFELDADVVLHCPLPSLVYGDDPDKDVADFCALLAGGVNVITTVGYMHPVVHGPALVARLESACRAGSSSFHGTGLNPGFLGELVPLALSALSASIEQIRITEISDFARYPSPEIMFGMMGFGKDRATFERDGARRSSWLNGLFHESIQLIADGLEARLDGVDQTLELELADSGYDVAAGRIPEGTVAGQRWRWAGWCEGRQAIVHETVWRMGPGVGTDWPTGPHSVVIDGKPAMRLTFPEEWLTHGLQATATHAVNAIPAVVAAEPGIRTFLDLPMIVGKGTLRPS